MEVRLVRPCAATTAWSGWSVGLGAQRAHTRGTAGLESTRTPSISKSTPLQMIWVMLNILVGTGSNKKRDLRADGLAQPRRPPARATPRTRIAVTAVAMRMVLTSRGMGECHLILRTSA